MNLWLLVTALIILISIVLGKLSNQIGIPSLLLYILLGISFTHPKLLNIDFQDFILVEKLATVALLFIMFYGGFNTRWHEAQKVAKPSITLASLGVVLTALITCLVLKIFSPVSWAEAFLVGAVLSSTDAASVFSIIRSKKLSLRYRTSAMLELESGSNDPASYLLTILALQILQGQARGLDILIDMFRQIILALILGYLMYKIAIYLYQTVKWQANSGSDTLFIFAMVVLTYALTSQLLGNGYLAVYLFGILLGNSTIENKVNLVYFFDGFTRLMQVMVFFLLGLLSTPSAILDHFWQGFLVFLVISIFARPLAVLAIMKFFPSPNQQIKLVSFSGLRGAASIVFAIMAHNQMGTNNFDIFHIVFVVVLFSILLQGSLLAPLAKYWNMTDPLGDPLKTFTDYAEEQPIEFVSFDINHENNFWANKRVKDIDIQEDLLLTLIQRGEKYLVPDGNTLLQVDDKAICIAKSFDQAANFQLKEFTVDKDSTYLNQKVMDLENDHRLFVLIKRGQDYIIPGGSDSLQLNDRVIYLEDLI